MKGIMIQKLEMNIESFMCVRKNHQMNDIADAQMLKRLWCGVLSKLGVK